MRLAQFALAALAAGLLSSAAVAGDHGGRGGHGERFRAMDTNGDGKVTRAEAEASAKSRFDEMDANKDGKLTGDELPGKGRWAKRHGGEGKDDDKADDKAAGISKSAFVDRALKRFDRLDQNSDGIVTQEEIDAAKEKFKSHRRGDH